MKKCHSPNWKHFITNVNSKELYESIRVISRNPNIDLQPIGIYSKSDIQHHLQRKNFRELLTKIDTIQRQSIDQNLRKLAETAGFSDVYKHDYSGYFKDRGDR